MESNAQWLGSYLLEKADQPLVFDAQISTWPAAKWTPEALSSLLGKEPIRFRIGKLNHKDIQLETECDYVNATVAEFHKWLSGTCPRCNALSSYSPKEHWCYADYKYMAEMFKDTPELIKDVDWSKFGFPGRDGSQSTFWLGSAGAYTVCHYDTYGCNLVAQIYGRKRWVLIPPEQTPMMYPSRLPYEESSVFSKVNIKSPHILNYPKFKQVTPHVVTLSPGQVLFVPRHWWHLVESLDTSISINTWIDMPEEDNKERLQEAVSRTLAFSLMDQDSDISWLNPTETLSDHTENITYLSKSLTSVINSVKSKQQGICDQSKEVKRKRSCDENKHDQPPLKKKPDTESTVLEDTELKTKVKLQVFNAAKLKPCTFQELREHLALPSDAWGVEQSTTCKNGNKVVCKDKDKSLEVDIGTTREKRVIEISSRDLLDCVLQPDVIKLITDKILAKVSI